MDLLPSFALALCAAGCGLFLHPKRKIAAAGAAVIVIGSVLVGTIAIENSDRASNQLVTKSVDRPLKEGGRCED